MKRRTLLQLSSLASVASLLSGCFGPKIYHWKQKLQVVVQTPEGEKTGDAVAAVTAQLQFSLGAAGTVAIRRLQGEATVVELGQGKYLFALLNEESKYLADFAFVRRDEQGNEEFWGRLEASKGSSATLPSGHYPMLVTFDNINDPKSVKEVKPSDLEAAFGVGYALKSITLEITDEKVTEGVVEKVLTWVSTLWPNQLDGSRYETVEAKNRFANSLNPGNFGEYSRETN
jgi:hypothetical protein